MVSPVETDGKLNATVCGWVERINKLIAVKPINSRYSAEIGDVVVGRVVELGDKKWRVDVNSRQFAILHLAAIHLPGNVQRRRTEADALEMRNYYSENDLIAAEVQQIKGDGTILLHTRSEKYGKVQGGLLVKVPCSLVKRTKFHYHQLENLGVDLILGVNGYIFIRPSVSDDAESSMNGTDTKVDDKKTRSAVDNAVQSAVTARERIARLRNSITLLHQANVSVSLHTIMDVYEHSESLSLTCSEMLDPSALAQLTAPAISRVQTNK